MKSLARKLEHGMQIPHGPAIPEPNGLAWRLLAEWAIPCDPSCSHREARQAAVRLEAALQQLALPAPFLSSLKATLIRAVQGRQGSSRPAAPGMPLLLRVWILQAESAENTHPGWGNFLMERTLPQEGGAVSYLLEMFLYREGPKPLG